MKAKTKVTKKNPQDTTLRNINALKKRIILLEKIACFYDSRLCELEMKEKKDA